MSKANQKFKGTSRKGAFNMVVPYMLAGLTVAIVAIVTFSLISTTQAGLSATSLAYYALNNLSQFFMNIFLQLPLAGTIFGYAIVIGFVGLIGVGAYMGYQQVAGGRGR